MSGIRYDILPRTGHGHILCKVNLIDPNGDVDIVLRNWDLPFLGDIHHTKTQLLRNSVFNRESDEFHFLVSSERLRRFSPVFSQALQQQEQKLQQQRQPGHETEHEQHHRRKEGEQDPTTDRKNILTLPLTKTNPFALLILLNAFHHHNIPIPGPTNTHRLVQVAMLVDAYRCPDAVRFNAPFWAAAYPTNLRHTVYWLYITIAFRLSSEFEMACVALVKRSRGVITGSRVPARRGLLDKLNRQRVNALSNALSALRNALYKARSSPSTTGECTARRVQMLNRAAFLLRKCSLETPFVGLSFEDVLEAVLRARHVLREREDSAQGCEEFRKLRTCLCDSVEGIVEMVVQEGERALEKVNMEDYIS